MNFISSWTKSFSNGNDFKVQGTIKRSGDFSAPNYMLSNTGTNEKNISAAVIQIESDRFINLQKFLFKNHLQKDNYAAFLEFIPSLMQKYPSVTKIVSEFNVARNRPHTLLWTEEYKREEWT